MNWRFLDVDGVGKASDEGYCRATAARILGIMVLRESPAQRAMLAYRYSCVVSQGESRMGSSSEELP